MHRDTGLMPALKGMVGEPPTAALDAVNFYGQRAGGGPIAEADIVAALTDPDPNSPVRIRFQLLISRWDSATDEAWTGPTAVNSVPRRTLIYNCLALSQQARDEIDRAYPRDPGAIVIEGAGGAWRPWYTAQRQVERTFYWDAYARVLESDPGWDSRAITRLDNAATAVVRRLADPLWPAMYQSRGLVVGFVQSGKTANFTGVIAKAIDAGYRLIVVLTGTVEILRRQTQRRLDMELAGVENILGGIDENNADQVATTDYHEDQDWIDGRFIRHGPIHNLDGVPAIRRLSTFEGDYRRLRQGLSTLDFRAGRELADRGRPLYDPVNLFRSDVRLAVVKKNSTVLKRLVDDLRQIRADLGEIPTLIIDDEADQASVNTKRKPDGNGKRKNSKPRIGLTEEEVERSAVNQRISDMLGLLKRAQYVGYTATPFANVFIDPDDCQDIFPKDFIVSLERPAAYMGARDFHDLDGDYSADDKTIDNSNEKAFVRDLLAVEDPARRRQEMQEALDAFVLAGALKLYRRERTGLRFRHHTMLIHESVRQIDHDALAQEVRGLWLESDYRGATNGMRRLRDLLVRDFAPVSAALHRRAVEEAARRNESPPEPRPMPRDFDELRSGRWIGRSLDAIERGLSPVIVVNGASEKDYAQDALDFQGKDVWKILIGGTKLSRGFTIEGLTVSYYTRRTGQADTLMQMGRWFGFRPGYRDLVRLYIGRNVPSPKDDPIDLYEAFEAVVRDEEDFRAELVRYSAINEKTGHPQITPEDVPPMVFQQVPWLKPTATNKMYNAELVEEGVGGQLRDFPRQADRDKDGEVNVLHFAKIRPLLDGLSDSGAFAYVDANGVRREFVARYGIVGADVICEALDGFKWTEGYSFEPNSTFIRNCMRVGTVTDFVVLLPELGETRQIVGSRAGGLPIVDRARRSDRPGFAGSSKRQRPTAETIAGKRTVVGGQKILDDSGGAKAVELRRETRGALLLTLTYDPAGRSSGGVPDGPLHPADVASLFSLALPYECAPAGRIGFRTKKSGGGAIIDRLSSDDG